MSFYENITYPQVIRKMQQSESLWIVDMQTVTGTDHGDSNFNDYTTIKLSNQWKCF